MEVPEKRSLLLITVTLCLASLAHAKYFHHDPDDPDQQAPIREGEKAVVPLDTGETACNLWQTPRDDLEEGRD